MIEINPKDHSIAKVHELLLGGVSPRPIALASTMDENENSNLSPFSFFNVFSANPPIVIFSPARRVRNNTIKHTLENVITTKEVVINIVNYDMVQQMSLSSTEYPKGVNEFVKSGLTPVESKFVKPFRVKESPMQIECKVNEIVELGKEGGAGNLIICEIIDIHIHENILDCNGQIDPNKINTVGRLGGDWYCRNIKKSIFKIKKPIVELGIGVDKIPQDILESKILTKNNLGQLGNIEALPNETDVNKFKLLKLSDVFIKYQDDAEQLEKELHLIASKFLKEDKVLDAWKTLLTFNNK